MIASALAIMKFLTMLWDGFNYIMNLLRIRQVEQVGEKEKEAIKGVEDAQRAKSAKEAFDAQRRINNRDSD